MSRFLDARYAGLEPYTPGEQPKAAGKLIKLNTNENPYPPAPGVRRILTEEAAAGLRLYSDPEALALREAIAQYYGLSPHQVIAGNGSDEILAFLFLAFQGQEGRVYYPEISYSFYPVYCSIFGARGIGVPLREDFSVAVADYAHAKGSLFITNPNAPTGMALTLTEIRELLEQDRNRLVTVDEAYVDFGGESAVSLLGEYDNLAVVQTFSKSRSLAGARIGFAMAGREIIDDLNRIKYSFNPYNLNRLSIRAGIEAVKDRAYFRRTCEKIIETREAFVEEMQALGFEVLPSRANFVMARCNRISGEEYFTNLRKYNIIVRHFSSEKICDYVRITIGTPEEMQALVRATEEILQNGR